MEQLSDPLTVCMLAITASVSYYLWRRYQRNFPPGPMSLPIVGYSPFLGKNPGETLMKMRSKYGPIMSLQVGLDRWVVLNSYDAINEALVKNGEVCSGRPTFYDVKSESCGVATVDYGPSWKKHRKFGISTLRGFGVGKKSIEHHVVEESHFLIELLLTKSQESLRTKLTWPVMNMICSLVLGSRFQYDDPKLRGIALRMRNHFVASYGSRIFQMIMYAPVLRYLPVFRGAWNRSEKATGEFLGTLRELLVEHKATFDERDIRDFADAYLKEITERGEDRQTFNEKQLLHYIRDLFEAGTGTTRATLYWAILALALRPKYQERIFKEIESAIGDSGIPSMTHQDQMPFTCAFILEVHRHRTLLPLSVLHKTTEDCVLMGYNIPKNTTVTPNLWAVHFDPEFFDEPEEFRPERFLDADGNFVKSNHVIAFSVGPRNCPGQQLAKVEVFIHLTSLIQKLRILPNPAKPLPPIEEGEYKVLTLEGRDFDVIFEKR